MRIVSENPQDAIGLAGSTSGACASGARGGRVLVIEDVAQASLSAASVLRSAAFEVDVATEVDSALRILQSSAGAIDALVTEVRLPGTSGFAVLEAARHLQPKIPTIIISAEPAVREAVRSIQAGADDYLSRPLGADFLRSVRQAVDSARRRAGGAAPRGASRKELVGGSGAMHALHEQVALVGPTRTTVLLTGETGSGKERIAQALHEASPRRNRPFVAVNCAALTETLLESELFGHEKGSFSGAHARREGRFKVADGGTIFLDEIGEISPAIQVKLLRVLQERQFERVGGNDTVAVDVRIVAATNRNLREMVEGRQFRADLYYRLNVVALEVPPLRARKEDIPALVEHILPRLSLELGLTEPALSNSALAVLESYDWPGNVRELENVLERALVLSQGRAISETLLAPHLLPAAATIAAPAPCFGSGPRVPGATFAEIERHAIMTTYEACGRSPQRTAEILGISARTVHYRLREYRGEVGRRRVRGWSSNGATPAPAP